MAGMDAAEIREAKVGQPFSPSAVGTKPRLTRDEGLGREAVIRWLLGVLPVGFCLVPVTSDSWGRPPTCSFLYRHAQMRDRLRP